MWVYPYTYRIYEVHLLLLLRSCLNVLLVFLKIIMRVTCYIGIHKCYMIIRACMYIFVYSIGKNTSYTQVSNLVSKPPSHHPRSPSHPRRTPPWWVAPYLKNDIDDFPTIENHQQCNKFIKQFGVNLEKCKTSKNYNLSWLSCILCNQNWGDFTNVFWGYNPFHENKLDTLAGFTLPPPHQSGSISKWGFRPRNLDGFLSFSRLKHQIIMYIYIYYYIILYYIILYYIILYYILISSRSKFHLRKNTHKMTCPKNGSVFRLFDPHSFAKPNIFSPKIPSRDWPLAVKMATCSSLV